MMDNAAVLKNNINTESVAQASDDTIVAQATAVGLGGVGIVRVSGAKSTVLNIISTILKTTLKPRYAYYGNFYNGEINNEILDKGLALYFPGPNSYTGEDVVEFHCHGGSVVIDSIINTILKVDSQIRVATPGEFTKRAWLNGKMDLAQVEAVSDLINATSKQAAQAAVNSLIGEFSNIINSFLQELIYLRVYIEAAIDFSDEQIDFIKQGEVKEKIALLKNKLNNIIAETKQGVILQEGVEIAIIGRPNAGKSSLLNALCRNEEAIVTDIPGTTRDIIKTHINIKTVPVTLLDTAGLRDSADVVEQKGVEKALLVLDKAQLILLLVDGSLPEYQDLSEEEIVEHELNNISNLKIKNKYTELFDKEKLVLIINKLDKISGSSGLYKLLIKNKLTAAKVSQHKTIFISAKQKEGIDSLEQEILNKIGFTQTSEGKFTARRRHLISLNQVENCLNTAQDLLNSNANQDIIAEELRLAQDYLANITGEFSSDDLLGNIFSSFCIGK